VCDCLVCLLSLLSAGHVVVICVTLRFEPCGPGSGPIAVYARAVVCIMLLHRHSEALHTHAQEHVW
jgi:hypothetical protein